MTAGSPWTAVIATPIGPLGLATTGVALTALAFLPAGTDPVEPQTAVGRAAARALMAYFENPACPLDLPLAPQGSAFQLRAWTALQGIGAGQIRTYGELAGQLGTSARAVGGACRRNPLAIVIPCHRVVATTGLGGYGGARGGASVEVKRWLLRHEGVNV